MKKRRLIKGIVALSSAVLLLGSCGNNGANEEEQVVYNDPKDDQGLKFLKQTDGTYAVEVGDAVLLETIEIPASQNGKAVTTLRCNSFSACDNLTKLILPKTIKTIQKPYLPKTLKTIEFRGKYSTFKGISFEKGWISHYSWTLKTEDKSVKFNDLFTKLKLTINDTENEVTIAKNKSAVGHIALTCDEFGGFEKYLSGADTSFSFNKTGIVSLEPFSGDDFKIFGSTAGETVLTFTYKEISSSIKIKVVAAKEFTNLKFEDKTFEWDGVPHHLDPVEGTPAGTTVYYSSHKHSSFEELVASNDDYYTDVKRILSSLYVDTIEVYAYVVNPAYYTKVLKAEMKIVDDYIDIRVGIGGFTYSLRRENKGSYSISKLSVTSGQKISIKAANSGNYSLKLDSSFAYASNLSETDTSKTYSQVTIKNTGKAYVLVKLINNTTCYISVTTDAKAYVDPYASRSKGGHIYFHFTSNENIDEYALWTWAMGQHSSSSTGFLWGANSIYLPSGYYPSSNGQMTKAQCGLSGNDAFEDKNGRIIDVDLSSKKAVNGRTGEVSTLIDLDQDFNGKGIGFLLVKQTSMNSLWKTYYGGDCMIGYLSNAFPHYSNHAGTYLHAFITPDNMVVKGYEK